MAGHLDRVLTGTTAHDVLNDDRWPTNRLQTTSSSHKPWTLKHIASIKPILSHHQTSHVTTNLAHVFTFNIRRLANDLVIKSRGPAGLLAPALETSASTTSIDAVVPDMLTFRPDKDDPIDSRQDTEIPAHDRKLELVSSIISSVMSWHVSEAFEDICRKTVSPSVITDAHLSYGIKGTNGNLSILAPMKDEKEAWKVSISMTASRLLTIALLGKAIISMAGQDGCSSDLISSYAIALSAVIGKDYCFPSLSLLSKYWQDPSARCLFSSAVTGLSKEDIVSLVNYWEAFLPTSDAPESDGSQMMARASVILGIMGCDQPQMLSSRVRKSTALSLTILLSDVEFEQGNTDQATVSSASMARMLSSMELLSQGFSTWESYINASEVLRTLFQYASDKKPTMSLVSRGAKGAIFEIAVTNMPLVIGTLTFDTMHCKKIDDRIRCLQIIGQFIRKKPILLYYNVHRVVEAVVKTLDPNIPHMREQVLPAATAILHDLVKVTTAQKLSVGTLEGASIIYDVRTATRSTVLEGHTGPVTVLAFSPDAKFIATCSLLDQTVRVWYANQSIFGMLTSSLSHGFGGQRHDQRDGTLQGSHKPYKIFSFALPNKEDGKSHPWNIGHPFFLSNIYI
ncbi:uncharacterized protein BYT42DRAFT_241066 [Radiomyces spectabilis]|uniref:uncharacterized protein n=1 Tax=Radiomyces spectabilis TaxID=64574 RepID=UPI00222095EF|nr:uncharacterized protein BYT42DRAFT_241066 [Radiomyces spectabilis]KAI8388613.1 hypothetical protein BYT42DRAFT_241066 [Radiomyces spectabilis]